jgi:hypothetical protein
MVQKNGANNSERNQNDSGGEQEFRSGAVVARACPRMHGVVLRGNTFAAVL